MYSCKYKHPILVAYKVKASTVDKNNYTRKYLSFKTDKKLPIICRSYPSDYRNTGYDRGHNAPNSSFDYNITTQKQTFLMSNVTPQARKLNRCFWSNLEEFVRYEARKHKEVEVITGSCVPTNKWIGKHKVNVPKYWFKIIYWKNIGQPIVVIMENNDSNLIQYFTTPKNLSKFCSF